MEITINTYGAYLHVKDDMFEIRIRDTATQVVTKTNVATHKVRTFILAQGIALSSDAVKLAMVNNIDIVFVESDGFPIARVWHSKLGSTVKIRKRQLETSLNADGIRFVKIWVAAKMENQRDFIQDLKKHRPQHADFLNDKITAIETLVSSVQNLSGEKTTDIADVLRGLEGTAGRLFFETQSFVLPKEHQFAGRSSRPAQDVYNAFLNYCYGILYRRTEKSLILAGIDPYVGFFHRDDYNMKSMVFDFIEPYRIWADTCVFRLFAAKKINKTHHDELANGVSLNKEGKQLAAEQFTDYLDKDTIRYKNKNITRGNALQFDCHNFAAALLEKNMSDE